MKKWLKIIWREIKFTYKFFKSYPGEEKDKGIK